MENAVGRCLIISPHPDDETLGCGAAIQQARQAGRPVNLIIVTDGSGSSVSSIISSDDLIKLRRAETIKACEKLGIHSADIIFLPFVDGTASAHIDAISSALQTHISQLKPVQIFSPYGFDGSFDHRAVAKAVDALCKVGVITVPVYEYPVWFWKWPALAHVFMPWGLLRLRRVRTEGFLDCKREALNAYASQTRNLTGENNWWTLSDHFLVNFFQPYEIFFEKTPR